jgi:hypothetical protein
VTQSADFDYFTSSPKETLWKNMMTGQVLHCATSWAKLFAFHFGLLVETDVFFSGGVGFGFGSRIKVLLLEVIAQMFKPLNPLFQRLDFQLLKQVFVLAHLKQDCKVTQS